MPSKFDPLQFPRRLNLGCGFDLRQGYLNVDLQPWHKPDLIADVGKLDFLPAGYYEEILAQDVLEHLPRMSTRKILVHWNRLLAPGGLLRLRLPDALSILQLLAAPANQSVARQEELIQFLFGTQGYTGDFHFTSFTAFLLRHYLQETGYDVMAINAPDDCNLEATARKMRSVHPHDVGDFPELLCIAGDAEFVRECYRSILKREGDTEGVQHYVSCLAETRMVRDAVIEQMLDSNERKALAERNRHS